MASREYKDSAGAIYAELIEAELADEWERKRSIEQRGQVVVSTVGVIATIAFAAAPFARGATPVQLPAETQVFLWEGIVFLVGAALFGLRANWPLTYEAAAAQELARLIKPAYWDAEPDLGSRRASQVRVEELARARATNGNKAWALAWGMNLEVLGTIMLGLGVAFVMAGSSVDTAVLVAIAIGLIALPIVAGVFGLARALWKWLMDDSGGRDRDMADNSEGPGEQEEAQAAAGASATTSPAAEGPMEDASASAVRAAALPAVALEFVTHVHRYLQDQIVLADAKAGVAAPVAGALFVAYREITSNWTFLGWADILSVTRGGLQLLTLLALLGTVIHAYRTLAPRMPRRYRRARLEFVHRLIEALTRGSRTREDLAEGGSLVRWPDLADRKRFGSPSAYAERVGTESTEGLSRNLAEHSIILADIAAEKHQQVRAVINYLLLAGLGVAVLSLVGGTAIAP